MEEGAQKASFQIFWGRNSNWWTFINSVNDDTFKVSYHARDSEVKEANFIPALMKPFSTSTLNNLSFLDVFPSK